MNNPLWNDACKTGVAGGTLLSGINAMIGVSDVMKTVILAVIGAVVSFGVSFLLKWLFNRKRKRR
jgi:hypothetical protein